MNLCLENKSFEIDDNLILYNSYRTHFITAGIEYAKKFKNIYKSCGDIQTALEEMAKFDVDCILKLSEFSCKTLFKHNIYDISSELFTNKYEDLYFSLVNNKNLEHVWNKIEKIAELDEEFNNKLNIRKTNRGHWQGGGFGLSGAIKGAVTASALNAVGGIAHGISDSVRSAWNNSKIKKMEDELYKDPDTINCICLAIFENCSNVFFGLRDELIIHEIISPINFKVNEAFALSENALKYSDSKQELQTLLINSIFMSPYSIDLYTPLYKNFKNTNGLKEFTAYFSVDKVRLFKQNLLIDKKCAEISQLSEIDLEDKCKKLIAFVNLSTESKYANYIVQNEIEKLSKQIIQKYGSSVKTIDETLNYINNNISADSSNESTDVFNCITKKLVSKKNQLINIANQEHLSALPENTTDDIINKIQQIVNYYDNFETSVHDQLRQLLKKLAQKCLNATQTYKVSEKLKKISSPTYSVISMHQSSFIIKARIYSYEEKVKFSTFFLFSPLITDVINEARSGNPVCQQWLVKLICNNELIKNLGENQLLNNANQSKKKKLEEICDYVSKIVLYLFDNPSKYSFDLFMRLKFNSIYMDNINDCIETMQVFSNDTLCPAGMYEYGLIVYKHKDNNEGIKIIEQAANLGYNNAIKYMYDYYSSKNLDTDKKLLFEILMSGKSEYDDMYNANENIFDPIFLITLSRIGDLVNFKYTLKIYGEKVFSNFLAYAWNDFKDNSKPFSRYEYMGFLNGDIADKITLKSVKVFLGANINEKCFFALQTKDSEHVILITDKNLRWKDGKELHRKSYKTAINQDLLGAFNKYRFEDAVAYQLYATTYFSCKEYSPELPIFDLEKMAYCGHPLAICHLLHNRNYALSDDKKEAWMNLKKEWQSQGFYFEVCPKCYKERTIDDLFCPDCGTKIH